MTIPKQIFIIAGEASGDILAAQLVEILLQNQPSLKFFGMGGVMMQKAGVKIILSADQLAIVGAWEVVTHLKQLREARNRIKAHLQSNPPALIILVDYPGFNLRIAKLANHLRIPVVYYVSPQIWAWHYRRIYKIKKYVNHMLVLFNFEEKIYQQHQIPVTFVGHPALDQSLPGQPAKTFYHEYQLNSEHILIALLPGSRQQEIKRLLPEMVAASRLLQQQFPQAQFILPLANNIELHSITTLCPSYIKIAKPPLVNILPFCQAAIVASGTATLEVALCETPMVIIYKTNWITYWLARWLVKLDKIGLCNIIAGKFISKELIQHHATPQAIATEITHILTHTEYRQQMINNFKIMKVELGKPGASLRAASAIFNLLHRQQDK